jgi:hypothetical protein
MTRQAPETDPPPYRPGHPKKAVFLAAYRRTGIILTACRQAEVPRSTYYWWTERDAAFATACEQAELGAVEQVEAELRRRALLKGPKTRDTTALIFYLKAHKPEKYRERFDVRHEDRLPAQVVEVLRELAATTRG